jgi:uncharacterized protein YjiK
MKTLKIVSLVVAIGAVAFFWNDIRAGVSSLASQNDASLSASEANDKEEEPASAAISVKKIWNLPEDLLEISGLSVVDNERFACVQDEMGTVYIYNTTTSAIEKKIPFTNPGDFEGIAVVDKAIWVVRADGLLFELDMDKKDMITREHKTSLTEKHNIEGLCYDKANQRLLLASKDGDEGKSEKKGIYAFDLVQKKFTREPVYEVDLTMSGKDGETKKGKKQAIKPSGIAIHPVSGEIYITDGPKSRLLILDKTGGFKEVHKLGKEFQQPEGIAFRDNGELFISNEGSKTPGNIIHVELKP